MELIRLLAGRLVDWCLTAFSAETSYIMPQKYEIYCVGLGQKTNTYRLYRATEVRDILCRAGTKDKHIQALSCHRSMRYIV